MTATFALLRDLRPYKTQWRIQVKVLHSWRQYTAKSGETLEMVLSDTSGSKIHASIKKDLVLRYANLITENEWRFIEVFSLTHATGQYRPTDHVYKMNFINGTNVRRSDNVSDSLFLNLAKFESILNDRVNQSILQDVMGQIVNIGELENIDVQGKSTKKVDFELRDESDERLPCTLWGKFAEQLIQSCRDDGISTIVLLLRFSKIKKYKDVISASNSFDATQCRVNPACPEVNAFIEALPKDGLTITYRESKPKKKILLNKVDTDTFSDYPRKTIAQISEFVECGKAEVICTIYAIDSDWSWYYFSCKRCTRKVTHLGTQNANDTITPKYVKGQIVVVGDGSDLREEKIANKI